MGEASRLLELEAVDRFLAEEKFLYGPMPEFGPSNFSRRKKYELFAVWPIADVGGVVGSGHLRVVHRPGSDDVVSISVIYGGQSISRLDVVPPSECHANPFWAHSSDLPPTVCGPHFHGWSYNREQVLISGNWELPCREPLSPQIRRFQQGFYWLCDRVNITLVGDQRSFDLPRILA